MKLTMKMIPIILLVSFQLTAQTDWKFTGFSQIRSEMDGRDFNNLTAPELFTGMRTWLAADGKVRDDLRFFFQIQDSRYWGEETATIANSKNLDLHQGFIMYYFGDEKKHQFQAGRFQAFYGSERIMGVNNWSYIARAYDGYRLSFRSDIQFDIFSLVVKENQLGRSSLANNSPRIDTGSDLVGMWLSKDEPKNYTISALVLFESNRSVGSSLNLWTVGGEYTHFISKNKLVIEGYYQYGKQGSLDVGAYLASASYNFYFSEESPADWTVGGDFVSATTAADAGIKQGNFRLTYGSNHKFYGYMDYFPAYSFNVGLQNFYFKTKYKLSEATTLLGDVHAFRSMNVVAGDQFFGTELDVAINHQLTPELLMRTLGTVFFPGKLMETQFGTTDPSFWLYLTFQVRF